MEKHSSNLISKSIGSLFKRFHLMIFFIFVVGCLAVTVIMVNQILAGEGTETTSTDPGTVAPIEDPSSSTVLTQLEKLHTSDNAPLPALPEGRINPFAE
jgi:hypothetical protein